MNIFQKLTSKVAQGVIRIASRPLAYIHKFVAGVKNVFSSWGASGATIERGADAIADAVDQVKKVPTWKSLSRQAKAPDDLFTKAGKGQKRRYSYTGKAHIYNTKTKLHRNEWRTVLSDKSLTIEEIEKRLQFYLPHYEGSRGNIVISFTPIKGKINLDIPLVTN